MTLEEFEEMDMLIGDTMAKAESMLQRATSDAQREEAFALVDKLALELGHPGLSNRLRDTYYGSITMARVNNPDRQAEENTRVTNLRLLATKPR